MTRFFAATQNGEVADGWNSSGNQEGSQHGIMASYANPLIHQFGYSGLEL